MQQATFIFAVFFGLGLVLVLGAFYKWPWLVDPPADWWPYYSQATIKKFLGRRVLLIYTYVLGAAFAIVGGIGLYRIIGS